MAVKKNKLCKIGVLMGGPSTEREISLKSGKAVYEALTGQGLDTVAIDIKTDSVDENTRLLKSHNLACAFIALHGRFGEDGRIQELLEQLGITYTGSGILASWLAMDKIASRRIFEIYGLAVPRYKVINKSFYSPNWQVNRALKMPLVVKPATHGSSIGLSLVTQEKELDKAIETALGFDENILIEEYIPGREITVGILAEKALPVVEIMPTCKFFDYQAKYSAGLTDYRVPADIEEEVLKRVNQAALKAHKFLNCAGCSRVDIILSPDNIPYILEVNTIPGLTETSLLPKAARAGGIEFGQLCRKLIELAYAKEKS